MRTVIRTTGGIPQDQWSLTVTPLLAAITTICAATALAGVIDGAAWLGYAGVAVVVVTATGLGLRAVRTPTFVVGMAQLLALLCLVVALFSDRGVLGFIPGPEAFAQLGDVLRDSLSAVRTGVPPVPADEPILCLVVIAIGLVAVVVDTLAVAAGTPAASGLVLLCVYAVPASLADEMLPWWSFVLGATSFSVLLAADGTHRHQRWRNRPALGGNGPRVSFLAPAALVGVALLLGITAGTQITAIGTVGQLPGGTGRGGASGGLGIKPFTELRGMLDRRGNTELFRVQGLGAQARYLRALTLRTFAPNTGWQLDSAMAEGVPASADLPAERGGETTAIQIQPVNSEDVWAPVYGVPRKLQNLPREMRYDPDTGAVYSERRIKLPSYVEQADLTEPTADQLRSAGSDFSRLNPVYRQIDRLDPRVTELARQITAGKPTLFDKAVALQRFFGPENGFSYQTRTAAKSDEDALVDFLFRGKAGYCEQYASAMAVLARAVGIPSRVAIGYTAGYPVNDERVITSQDAHAWVEVYFPGFGWTTFDPTPLADGRSYTPPYLSTQTSARPNVPEGELDTATPTTTAARPPSTDAADPGARKPDAAAQGVDDRPTVLPWLVAMAAAVALAITLFAVLRRRGAGAGRGPGDRMSRYAVPAAAVAWCLAVVLASMWVSWWLTVAAVVVGLAAVPACLRLWWRRHRLDSVHALGHDAAKAAWDELLAESWDRGTAIPETDTVRAAARRLAREHRLDDAGREGLRTMVGVVERSWYGAPGRPDPALPEALEHVRSSLRRNAPLALRAKLLPRSVFRRPHRGSKD